MICCGAANKLHLAANLANFFPRENSIKIMSWQKKELKLKQSWLRCDCECDWAADSSHIWGGRAVTVCPQVCPLVCPSVPLLGRLFVSCECGSFRLGPQTWRWRWRRRSLDRLFTLFFASWEREERTNCEWNSITKAKQKKSKFNNAELLWLPFMQFFGSDSIPTSGSR